MDLYSYPKWNVIIGEKETYPKELIDGLLEFSKKYVLLEYSIDYLKEIYEKLSMNILGESEKFETEIENDLRGLMQAKFTMIIEKMIRTFDLEIDNQKLVETFGKDGMKEISKMLKRYSMEEIIIFKEELIAPFIIDKLKEDGIEVGRKSSDLSPLDLGETFSLEREMKREGKDRVSSIIRVRTPFHLVPSVTILRQIPEGLPSVFRFFPIWRSVRDERKLGEDEIEKIRNKLSEDILDQLNRGNQKWEELSFRLLLDREYMKGTRSTFERIKRTLKPFSIEIIDENEKESYLDVVIPQDYPRVYNYILSCLENVRERFSPRKLTSSEINQILEAVPRLPGKFVDITQSVRSSLQDFLREQLGEIILTPLGISDLIEDMERKFQYATRDLPQTPVGLIASEALAGPITQMTLNTFHQSGTSVNATSGIDAVRELIHLSKHRKNYNCVIHFKNKDLTFMEVADMRKDLVGIRLGSIVTRYEVDQPENLGEHWWTKPYIETMGIKKFPESKWIMRMYLNVDSLYNYRIKMEDIVNVINNSQEDTLKIVPSPLSYGIIDLYPQPEVAAEYTRTKIVEQVKSEQYKLITENADLLFLQRVVVPNYPKFLIKGIPGINRLFPQTISVLSIVKEEIREYSDTYINNFLEQGNKNKGKGKRTESSILEEGDRFKRIWRLVFNQFRMINTGIDQEKLEKLLTAAGIGIQKKTDNYLIVEIPPVPEEWMKAKEPNENAIRNETVGEVKKNSEGKPKIDYTKPSNFIQKKIEEDREDEENKEEMAKQAGNKLYLREPTLITRAANYVIAESDGTNLRDLLGNSLIDSRYTISNDFYEIFHILGIEALRNFLIKEFINVIASSSSYINPRHIVLLVEFMTNQGIPLPSTHTGISRQPTGAITKATLDRAADTFKSAAGFGKVEAINTTSASICVGKKVSVGTGKIGVISDSETRKQLEDAKQSLKSIDKLSENELDALINPANVGMQFADPESDLDLMFAPSVNLRTPKPQSQFQTDIQTNIQTDIQTPQSNLSLPDSDQIQISGPTVISPLLKEGMKTLQLVPYQPVPETVTTIKEVVSELVPELVPEVVPKVKLVRKSEKMKILPSTGTSTGPSTGTSTGPPKTNIPLGIFEVKSKMEDFVGGF